ncbi:MocR-like pyridoxine biosynthesis transcription factor PdxR [Massilia niastensis]|uniref:MocR-like pyridoxine biosynthesis transcription factor PdxR n=1 Tax=Massilia niastensis TaxID=544911 RepID=UPI0003753D12|nr:PLP-dependent aminotransferase family protein [Massilia niastensis]
MQDFAARDYLSFDAASPVPLYRQIYARVREAVDTGVLRPGDRIPATRVLAQELGLARGTVAAAYALLSAEGYLEVRGAAGSVIAARHASTPRAPMTPRVRPLPLDVGGAIAPLPFQLGLPALDAFPRKVWARMAARAARSLQTRHLVKDSAFGASSLRTAIASYLQLSRGIDCMPCQVFITSGYRDALGLVARALLAPGERAWTEDPGFPPTRQVLKGLGFGPVPVPVDEHGIDIARGAALAPDARMAVVTPAHQSPLTITMSPARRQALLDWAQATGAWVVEDDYDGEFRYTGRPLPALASMDRGERVVYCGSFSKVMFPALRLSYVVVPTSLVERFEDAASLVSNGSPALTQGIVCDFMQDGHFVRHIQAMRRLYAERRDYTARALAAALGSRAEIAPQAGGLHLVARVAPGADRAMAERLREHGLAPMALADFYAGPPERGALLLSFTNVTSPAQAGELARRVAQALDMQAPYD